MPSNPDKRFHKHFFFTVSLQHRIQMCKMQQCIRTVGFVACYFSLLNSYTEYFFVVSKWAATGGPSRAFPAPNVFSKAPNVFIVVIPVCFPQSFQFNFVTNKIIQSCNLLWESGVFVIVVYSAEK